MSFTQVGKTSGDDAPFFDEGAVDMEFFEHQVKGISGPKIQCKADVPLIDVAQFHDYIVG